MSRKAKDFSVISAYDAAHASVASMGVRTIFIGYDTLVQVVAEAIFGGAPDAAIDRLAEKENRSVFAVWKEIRQCLDISRIRSDVLSVVRNAVQLGLEGVSIPENIECYMQHDGRPIDRLAEVDLLRSVIRDLINADCCDDDDEDDIGDRGEDED